MLWPSYTDAKIAYIEAKIIQNRTQIVAATNRLQELDDAVRSRFTKRLSKGNK